MEQNKIQSACDITINMPMSGSIVFAFADDETKARMLASIRVSFDGLAAGRFQHFANRDDDFHPHSHRTVPNPAKRADEKN